jgi:methionyl-tRNA synthetase
MIAKELDGVAALQPTGPEDPLDHELEVLVRQVTASYREHMDRYAPHRALEQVWELVRFGNRYVQETAPWQLARSGEIGRSRLQGVLYRLAELLRIVATMLFPVMPHQATLLWQALGQQGTPADSGLDRGTCWGAVHRFEGIERGDPLFPKVDLAQLGMVLESDAVQAMPIATKALGMVKTMGDDPVQITVDDVAKLDLRVATIVSAEPVAGANKLLKLQLDVAGHERQIVSGIAQHYSPEQLVGTQIVLIANLKPAKLRGVESQGMLLAADGGDGTVVLIRPESTVVSGARVR